MKTYTTYTLEKIENYANEFMFFYDHLGVLNINERDGVIHIHMMDEELHRLARRCGMTLEYEKTDRIEHNFFVREVNGVTYKYFCLI